MSHQVPVFKLCNRIQMQNKDQLTQGGDQPANDNYSWQDSNNPEILMSLNMHIKSKSTRAVLDLHLSYHPFARLPTPLFK